ncbi:tetratricopeptide repeat protein [Erythrobacter sp.]|uniref:tetratricopeptide repeat protein n=1 Tax=Erythrobacter sp. TaxID=1042 RepID=UPI001B135D91|nr:tetratricopeptide repeat protein [Erythrobacter sp.]MBO6527182.1 tetratricopeptide repeat protein [Erythrobacter sp.]MBO6529062.1 tetratricopeptide repeat protein [Erythrobacter sp.]
MSWLPILALAALVFGLAVYLLKLPRSLWMLFGSALLFGLAGYAMQGNPGQPAAPTAPVAEEASQTGELLVEARREFYPEGRLPSRFVVTADAFTRRGQHEQAANFLRNAVAENPQDSEAWLALGNALVEHANGQLTAAALYAYSRSEQVAPANPAPTYFLGLAYLRAGEPGRTLALWRELLENAPEGTDWRGPLAARLERLEAMLGVGPVSSTEETEG